MTIKETEEGEKLPEGMGSDQRNQEIPDAVWDQQMEWILDNNQWKIRRPPHGGFQAKKNIVYMR